MAKKRTVQRLLSELDQWVGRPQNREILHDFSRQSLLNYLDSTIATPNGALSMMASWHGQNGAHRVVHEDLSGWREISASLEYRTWNERTLFAMLEKRKAKSILAADSVFVLLHAISTVRDEVATWFGTRLISAFQSKDERITGWNIPLHSFALHLFAKWKQLPFSYSAIDSRDLGVYHDLLDGWDDQTAFPKLLLAACDYHVKQAFDDSEEDTQDFFHPLYDLFPVEILAVKRVREYQGNSMPVIDHPLMKTRMAKLPERMPNGEDDLLTKVSLKVCSEFGIKGIWDLA